MERATEPLRALLAAAVVRSSDTTLAAVTAGGDQATSAQQVLVAAPTASSSINIEATHTDALFTVEDRIAWDAIVASDGGERQQLADDIGLLIATTSVSDAKLVRLLSVLVRDPSFHSAGVLLVVQTTYRGFKVAKRWDALALAARELPDAVFEKIYARETALLALQFWLELLLGYQHEAELYLRHHTKLAALAVWISEQLRGSSGDASHVSELEAMKQHLILACAALIHCHRGYEHERYVLQRAFVQAFGADAVAAPSAVGAEALLRDTAWVLPFESIGKYLPSVEGKWVADEFAGEPHALGVSASPTAGSVLLHTTRHCVAHELSASVVGRDGAQMLRLSGLLFQQLPELQSLLGAPESSSSSTAAAMVATPWELEGHWSQVYESAPARASAPVASVTAWTCHACTMSNDAAAAKCATCGTASPAPVTIRSSLSDVPGSNPAPFTATFDASYTFMRVSWSRGEQRGVWLAKQQAATCAFELRAAIARASDSMTDSQHLPMHAYSPDGKAARVLLLEKPVVASSSSSASGAAELTVQLWVRASSPPLHSSDAQVVLAYGSELALTLTSAMELVWDVADGKCSLRAPQPLRADTFHHITLSLGQHSMALSIDGALASELAFSDTAPRSSLFVARAPVFAIGGQLSGDSISSVFSGAICDVRIWSTAQPSIAVTASLVGDEAHLLGYYPLVDAGPRLLMDVSKAENHATVFEAYARSSDRVGDGSSTTAAAVTTAPVIVSDFAPTAVLEALPVAFGFASTLGDAFVASGRFALLDGAHALAVDTASSGAAIWHAQPVALAAGFDTRFQVQQMAAAAPRTSTVVFALCDATYWSVAPLIVEASSTLAAASSLAPLSPSLTGAGASLTALFVSIEAVCNTSSGDTQYAIALWVRTRKHSYKLGAARHIVAGGDGSDSSDAPVVRVTYALPGKVLTVSLGASSDTVFECAVDVALALGLQSVSSVRAGLVFPCISAAASASAASAGAVRLCEWRYNELAPTGGGDVCAPSALASVYADVAAFQPPRASGDMAAAASEPTVVCTRCATDGSAIEQESYGCQTCNLIHGSMLCRVCAAVCHEGHELVAMGVLSAACACHLRGSGLCRCSTPVRAADLPQLQHPIATTLWCCSKCTVLNATTLRTCSICGHAAPVVASSAATTAPTSAGAGASPPLSTSRALALVETPTIEDLSATDWSCDACTMLNAANATKCTICDTVRAKPAAASEPPSAAVTGMLALYSTAESVATPSAAIAPVTWTCAACTMENKSADSVCYMCSTPNTVILPAAATEPATEVIMTTPPVPTSDPPLLPVPIDLTYDDSGAAAASGAHRASSPSAAAAVTPPPAVASAAVANLRFLCEYKRTVAETANAARNVVDALRDSSWESTAGGVMRIALHQSCVATYVDGAYAERDSGYVRGVARVTSDGVWKLEGKYRKLPQACENAVVLQWDASATRFDGKWFRGDGAGDWKCVLAPATSLFRGLRRVEDSKDTKDSSSQQQQQQQQQLQPFYSGLVNMTQGLTNVCYQNSFLQTLFMTQAFRRLILSCDLAQYPSVINATGGAGTGADVLSCVQHLFARLLASQQPAFATHALQRCLPPTFQAGRQQDTSDFAHYVIDSLSEQLSQQGATRDSVADIFGGVQATVLACKSCGTHSVHREYFWELLLNLIDLRYTPITGITAVSGASLTIATPHGYERLNTDVNKDRTGAPYVFLCVKRSPERACSSAMVDVDDNENNDNDASLLPITDLVVKVAPFHDVRPTLPGYERVELDLNVGGSANVLGGKKQVYLFTRREPNGSPITDLQVIYNNESVPDGFKQINVDLNQGDGGTKVFLCYRCDMPITDVRIVNGGIPGYKMVDHLLDLRHDEPVKQYLAYKVGGSEPCVTDMELVDGASVAQYEADGWASIGSPTASVGVSVDDAPTAASAASVPPAQLMVRRGHGNPIFAVDVFRAPRQVPKYNDYEVIDVYPRCSTDARDEVAAVLQGDWMASDDTDRARRAVRIHWVSPPLPHALVLHGAFEDKGEILAVASATTSWASAAGGVGAASDMAAAADDSAQVYRVTGHWKSSKVKYAQLFDVELRPDAATGLYALSGTIGDGRGRSVVLQGTQTSRAVKVKWPISELLVLRGDERVPEGVKVVRETCSGRSGNLLAQTSSPHSLYLAVKREEQAPASSAYVSDVCVIYGEIDVVPEGFTCIDTTPGGFSANVNDGTPGVPIFICYRRASAASDKVLMDVLPMWTSGPQIDTLPAEFTKIQHTPLGMDANLNEGTQGVAIHLCVGKTDPARVVQPVASALNGEYEITSAASSVGGFARFLSLSAMERVVDARVVEGKFGTVLHTHLPGAFRATVFRASQRRQTTLLGVWSLEAATHPTTMSDFAVTNYPFELALSDSSEELDGWWSGPDDAAGTSASLSGGAIGAATASTTVSGTAPAAGGAWKLMKDAYVRVGFKKDYGTEWKDGRLIASERVWRHDIASMLSRFVATRTLGGDNARACATCARKTESRTHTVIVTPPAHLILTIKRMFYDWTQQKTRKSLHDVAFPALLTLPALSRDDEDVVFGSSDDAVQHDSTSAGDGDGPTGAAGTSGDQATRARDDQRSRQYGLYGVLIHSGMTANSGHYYSFCRESDDAAQQLHLEDAPAAPWIKFNDTKVTRSSWQEIRRLVAHSVSDAVYLLLYKRLSYAAPPNTTGLAPDATESAMQDDALDAESSGAEDDEAMLLAKAMALSMSAAGRTRESVDRGDERDASESKRDDDDGDDVGVGDASSDEPSSVVATLPPPPPHQSILPSILKEVERENATFLRNALAAMSSRLHADDLHTLLLLMHAAPLHLRALLEHVRDV